MVQLTGHVRRYPSPLWSLRAARSVGPPVWHHLLSPLTGSQSQATAVCECAGVAWATPGRGWDIFPLMWVNNVINHPFGNGLYHFFMVMTGGWFMMVYYCFTLFTHMIYPFTSFSFVLFVNSRIKAQRAGWHCQCLRMSQIFDLWRSRGSEADGSCYSALTAWSWPKPQLKSCRVWRLGAKRRLDAVRLSSPRVTSRSASVARLFPLLGPSVLVFACQVASVKLALCMKSSICIAKKSNVRLGWLLQNMHLLSRLPLSFKHQKRPSFNMFQYI
jgi:hypothetical protein